MIEWRDEGALLKVRKHGENSAIIEVFTQNHGKAAGIVRGGTSRKIAPLLQPGAQLDVTWKARLENHLGSFTIEPVRSRAAQVMQDRLALAGLNAVTGILAFVLPERETHPPLYDRTIALLDLLGQNEIWPLAYLQWEIALLEEMGFALDLSACAVSGLNDDLFYVSPRTGRAVSRLAAGEWADRLLPLPKVMLGKGDADIPDILIALKTTGHFLHHHLAKSLGDRPLPDARQRLIDVLKRST
ncbi:DNA repair protein RecO [Octadecabacter sp. CECT 8868]|uniref:DNA repair protein RecO n=1 Tax=Octadecabacter algicola TaxID=2909342 RepID=UPI001F209DD8|nr:DNA repair protein RecO [Octadecabacter algicola]MCF2905736.1 DNA repair protein RecO [Octadecabacter algicola]